MGEAFGSYYNFAPFLLTERQINAAKGAIFGLTEPRAQRSTQTAIDAAIADTTDDSLNDMFAWVRAVSWFETTVLGNN